MASPQLENGYTKIANEILDCLCCFRIPGELRLVLDSIIRKTYGYNKKEDRISNSQFVLMTGLKKGDVSRSLAKLLTHRIVSRSDNKLRLNKNYEEWISFSKKLAKEQPKLAELLTEVSKRANKKLAKVGDTKEMKETIKETIQKGKLKEFKKFKDEWGNKFGKF
jgi:phage replication O-like protein O